MRTERLNTLFLVMLIGVWQNKVKFNMKRKPGYYWVKRCGRWDIGLYSPHDVWYFVNINGWFSEDEFEEVDENEIERSEKWPA